MSKRATRTPFRPVFPPRGSRPHRAEPASPASSAQLDGSDQIRSDRSAPVAVGASPDGTSRRRAPASAASWPPLGCLRPACLPYLPLVLPPRAPVIKRAGSFPLVLSLCGSCPTLHCCFLPPTHPTSVPNPSRRSRQRGPLSHSTTVCHVSMSENRKTKRSGSKQRHKDSAYSKSGSRANASSATSKQQSQRSKQQPQLSRKTQKPFSPSSSSSSSVSSLFANNAASSCRHEDAAPEEPLAVIDASSLISLCSPFVVPESSHRLAPNRYGNSTDIDLSVIYGSLSEKPLSPAAPDYHMLGKQKLLSTLMDNLSLIESDSALVRLDGFSIDSGSLSESCVLNNSDSDYDSNIDSDIDLIDEAILSSNNNQTVLIPSAFDKPSTTLSEVRINNTPLF